MSAYLKTGRTKGSVPIVSLDGRTKGSVPIVSCRTFVAPGKYNGSCALCEGCFWLIEKEDQR